MEQLERTPILHTQEVRGSSPCAPTICFQSFTVTPKPASVDFWFTQTACFFFEFGEPGGWAAGWVDLLRGSQAISAALGFKPSAINHSGTNPQD